VLRPIFWICWSLLAWTYVAYPAGIVAMARLRPRRPLPTTGPTRKVAAAAGPVGPASVGSAARETPSHPTPFVSVILAVRDGAEWLDGRIDNLLAQEYPGDRLEVVVVCNGSRDGSEAMARARATSDGRVRVLESPAGDGKAGALNTGVAAARGEVLVFADVRQRFDPGAIGLLVAALDAPGVGGVTGRLVVGESHHPGVEGFNRYWELETQLRLAEAATGSVVGATGAIYAVRRDVYQPVPPGTLLDDVHVPARLVLAGERMVMEPRAVARDVPTRSVAREYRRRVRTLAGNLQLVSLMPELLRPGNPLFVRFLSHKLLRVLSPLFFVGLLITGLWVGEGFYLALALALLFLYLAGLAGLLLPHRVLALPAAFVLIHAAAFDAIFRRRRAADLWAR
jgi:cellulose synthase/poly-beta-1,6-N-acetylglucosamine synthase-like glycosyltransferase